jgi:predicted enzyme related to lactoylglutathione lyase
MVLPTEPETKAMSEDHGRFIWYELLTTDREAAKRFYGEVVGWTYDDMNMGDMIYSVANADGNGMGGIMLIPPEAKAMGAPPHWSGYVYVDDCDAAAEKIKSLGGSVMRAPDDIPGIGRFAVVGDPSGAVFEVMKPVPPAQERPKIAPGTKGHTDWRELYSGDVEQALTFYGQMFGWRKDAVHDMGPMGSYVLFANQDGQIGGMMTKPPQVARPAWLYYFQVGDIDAAAGRVTNAGGKIVNGPMEVPGGAWIIQAVDPQGAMFALVGQKA